MTMKHKNNKFITVCSLNHRNTSPTFRIYSCGAEKRFCISCFQKLRLPKDRWLSCIRTVMPSHETLPKPNICKCLGEYNRFTAWIASNNSFPQTLSGPAPPVSPKPLPKVVLCRIRYDRAYCDNQRENNTIALTFRPAWKTQPISLRFSSLLRKGYFCSWLSQCSEEKPEIQLPTPAWVRQTMPSSSRIQMLWQRHYPLARIWEKPSRQNTVSPGPCRLRTRPTPLALLAVFWKEVLRYKMVDSGHRSRGLPGLAPMPRSGIQVCCPLALQASV